MNLSSYSLNNKWFEFPKKPLDFLIYENGFVYANIIIETTDKKIVKGVYVLEVDIFYDNNGKSIKTKNIKRWKPIKTT